MDAHDLLEDISSAKGSFELGIRSLVPRSTISFVLLNFLISINNMDRLLLKEHWPARSLENISSQNPRLCTLMSLCTILSSSQKNETLNLTPLSTVPNRGG